MRVSLVLKGVVADQPVFLTAAAVTLQVATDVGSIAVVRNVEISKKAEGGNAAFSFSFLPRG